MVASRKMIGYDHSKIEGKLTDGDTLIEDEYLKN